MWTPVEKPSFDEPDESHGNVCVPRCVELAVPSPLDRDRPPMVRCAHCGAEPGVACVVRRLGGRTGVLQKQGRYHPSRLEAAA